MSDEKPQAPQVYVLNRVDNLERRLGRFMGAIWPSAGQGIMINSCAQLSGRAETASAFARVVVRAGKQSREPRAV